MGGSKIPKKCLRNMWMVPRLGPFVHDRGLHRNVWVKFYHQTSTSKTKGMVSRHATKEVQQKLVMWQNKVFNMLVFYGKYFLYEYLDSIYGMQIPHVFGWLTTKADVRPDIVELSTLHIWGTAWPNIFNLASIDLGVNSGGWWIMKVTMKKS